MFVMELGWILGGLFIFVTLVFMAIALFLPEWVGITGKKAKQTMEEQKGDNPTPDDPRPPKQPSSHH